MNATRPTGNFAQISIEDYKLLAERLPRATTAVVAVYAYIIWRHTMATSYGDGEVRDGRVIVRRNETARDLGLTCGVVSAALRNLVDIGLVSCDSPDSRWVSRAYAPAYAPWSGRADQRPSSPWSGRADQTPGRDEPTTRARVRSGTEREEKKREEERVLATKVDSVVAHFNQLTGRSLRTPDRRLVSAARTNSVEDLCLLLDYLYQADFAEGATPGREHFNLGAPFNAALLEDRLDRARAWRVRAAEEKLAEERRRAEAKARREERDRQVAYLRSPEAREARARARAIGNPAIAKSLGRSPVTGEKLVEEEYGV